MSAGCGASEGPIDPLDPELIRELARAQGSPSASARSGVFKLDPATESCDCPSLELEGQQVDICALVAIPGIQVQLLESQGVLALADGAESKSLMLTGAIEADGSFIIAEARNFTMFAGPLEALRRMDGQFFNENTAEGWAGQRLLGELGGEHVDCRWIGSFVAMRQ
ncbi:MAG: hypothetical protein R6X02_00880 [Enhygromyxa sp.]